MEFPWISGSTVQWAGTNDGEQKGYELSLTANPTKNWRIMFNGAKQYSASANFSEIEQRWHDTQLAYLEANYSHLLDFDIPGVSGAAFRRIALPADSPRGGLLT